MNDIHEKIKADIHKTIGFLMKNKLILNPLFSDKNCNVSRIASNLTGSKIQKDKSYVENFLRFYNNSDYLFLFQDHSFIQVNYEFSKDKASNNVYVSKANLNFYPNPGLYDVEVLQYFSEDVAEEEQVQFWNDLKLDMARDFTYHSNYMRLDYSNNMSDFIELLHPKCHIHIGLNNNFRIGTDKLPLLSDFIDLILFTSYRDDWEKIHKKELQNSSEFNSNRKRKFDGYDQLTEFEEVLTESEKLGFLLKII